VSTLLYISYGTGPHEQEVVYSILSARHWTKPGSGYRVLILTDHPDSFSGIDAQVEFISPQEWKEWSGPANFAHRRKILALQHAMNICDGTVVLLDGDTWLRAPAERLFDRVAPGKTLMHIREGRICSIATPLMRSVRHLLQHMTLIDEQGNPYQIPQDCFMWNAGVIGIHQHDKDCLPEVLGLTDSLLTKSDLHVLEQFAFSWVLTKRTHLAECPDLVFHYWPPYLHQPFRRCLPQLFQQSLKLSEEQRPGFLFANRPRPTALRRGKVLVKRILQFAGIIRGRCRSNEW
jgi:hypothetical protein